MSREVIIQRIEKSDLIDAKKELMIDLVNSKKEDNFDENFLSSIGFSIGDIEEQKFYIVTIQVNLSEIDFENNLRRSRRV